MCEFRSLIYRLVISKSVKVASSKKQGWRYGTVRKYGAVYLNVCLEIRYAGMVRLFCNGKGTVRYYGKLQKLK